MPQPIGGLGGGGRGSYNVFNATAGLVNTGGGGGSGRGAPIGGARAGQAGGSGIVVINYPNAYRLPQTTGDTTIYTMDSNIIVKFTGSGTITF